MSHQAMSWAESVATGSGTRKCVLLLLANGACPHGVLWWGLGRLVDASEFSRRTVLSALRDMEAAGLLLRVERRRANGSQRSSLYVLAPAGDRGPMHPWEQLDDEGHVALVREAIAAQGAIDAPLLQGAGAAPGGCGSCTPGGATDAPLEPPIEPPLEPTPSLEAGAREPVKSVKYRGKTVPPQVAVDAERLLSTFATAVGRRISPWTAAGAPSPALRQVVGALMDRPDSTVRDWEAGIAAIVASPPDWWDGPPQLGQVFGEKAAEWTLAAPHRKPARQSRQGGSALDHYAAMAEQFAAEEAAATSSPDGVVA